MGYNLAWVAVRGRPKDAILAELGLRPTGEREEFSESEFTATEMPGGWTVVVANHMEPLHDLELVQSLSRGGEAVLCIVLEGSMVSHASGHANGRLQWQVDYGGSLEEVQVNGAVPPVFGEIRTRIEAEQVIAGDDADHVFEIPTELAKALTGFSIDEDLPGSDPEPFEVLEAS